MTEKAWKIIPIEEVRRRRKRLEFVYFGWYFLGYSAVVFWSECVLVLFGALTFYLTSAPTFTFAPIPLLLANVALGLVLAIKGAERHTYARYRKARKFALRFNPLCMAVWIPWFVLTAPYRIVMWYRKPLVDPNALRAIAEQLGLEDDDDTPVA